MDHYPWERNGYVQSDAWYVSWGGNPSYRGGGPRIYDGTWLIIIGVDGGRRKQGRGEFGKTSLRLVVAKPSKRGNSDLLTSGMLRCSLIKKIDIYVLTSSPGRTSRASEIHCSTGRISMVGVIASILSTLQRPLPLHAMVAVPLETFSISAYQ